MSIIRPIYEAEHIRKRPLNYVQQEEENDRGLKSSRFRYVTIKPIVKEWHINEVFWDVLHSFVKLNEKYLLKLNLELINS